MHATADHALSQIGALLGLQNVVGWFDGPTRPAVELDFVHNRLPKGAEVRYTKRDGCTNTCKVPIDRDPAGGVLVVSGFLFDTADGDATAVRSIAVVPDPSQGWVTMTLTGPSDVKFDAALQYAYVPKDRVVGGKAHAGTKTNPDGKRRTKIVFPELKQAKGATLLHGFSLKFSGRARKLQTLIVALVREAAVVRFDDADKNDAYTAWVAAARLK